MGENRKAEGRKRNRFRSYVLDDEVRRREREGKMRDERERRGEVSDDGRLVG